MLINVPVQNKEKILAQLAQLAPEQQQILKHKGKFIVKFDPQTHTHILQAQQQSQTQAQVHHHHHHHQQQQQQQPQQSQQQQPRQIRQQQQTATVAAAAASTGNTVVLPKGQMQRSGHTCKGQMSIDSKLPLPVQVVYSLPFIYLTK